MPTDAPSYVQVSPDSTGKKIASVGGQQVGSDGSTSSTQIQMIAVADLDGNQTEVDTISIVYMLQRINETLEQMLNLMSDAYGSDLRHSAVGRVGMRVVANEKTKAGSRLIQR